jgi:diadenosine tetraphosphate (Ap4A) HIT family hydrolase
MSYDQNNIFAKILRKEIPCNKVYEDDYALAFHDISPKAKIHVLVIPKGDFINFEDFIDNASNDLKAGFYVAISKITKQLGITSKGFRLISNTGLEGGQEVPHYHVHILGGEKLGAMVGK